MNINDKIRDFFQDSAARSNPVRARYYGDPMSEIPFAGRVTEGLQGGAGPQNPGAKAAGTLGLAGAGAGVGALAGGPVGALIGGTAGLLTGASAEVGSRRQRELDAEDVQGNPFAFIQDGVGVPTADIQGDPYGFLPPPEDVQGTPYAFLPRSYEGDPYAFLPDEPVQDVQGTPYAFLPRSYEGNPYGFLDDLPSQQGHNTGPSGVEDIQGDPYAFLDPDFQVADNNIVAAPPPVDPYQQFIDAVTASYDPALNALADSRNTLIGNADLATQRINDNFEYARGVAEEGRGVVADTYSSAQSNVSAIHDDADSRLAAIPQQQTDIAARAGGAANAQGVGASAAKTTAPFAAANASSRASANTNLERSSAAGQNYLTQLASANVSEAAYRSAAVDQALQGQLDQLAFQTAQLEGARARALAEIAMDVAGSTAEQMSNQTLAAALGNIGIDVPPGVDPMDWLEIQSDILGVEGQVLTNAQKEFNLQEDYASLLPPEGSPEMVDAIDYLSQFQGSYLNSDNPSRTFQLRGSRDTERTFVDILDTIEAEMLESFSAPGGIDMPNKDVLLAKTFDAITALPSELYDRDEKDVLRNAMRIYFGD